MKIFNFTGESNILQTIASLLNKKAPLPQDQQGGNDWGTDGQVLGTDGNGGTKWVTAGGGASYSAGTGIDITNDVISLSDETYTSAEKSKLSGIEAGAEVNVQADWTEADSTSDAYIKNKPNLATVATSGSYTDLTDKPTIPSVGGHTIEKSDGTDMTQRANLEFVGSYLADDAGNDRTIANIVRTMTQAQFNALSAAEKEGFIYISDAAGQLTASEVALAAIAGMSATTVQSGIAELKSLIGSIGRTVTTLVNESTTIATGTTKTYSALTLTSLQTYDEIHFMFAIGNVLFNGMWTKAQMNMVAGISSGKMYIFGGQVVAGGSVSLDYKCKVYADASGLNILNQSLSSSFDKVLIEGIKYN